MAWEVPTEFKTRLERQKRIAATLPRGTVRRICCRYHRERWDYLDEQYSPSKSDSEAGWDGMDTECRQVLNESMKTEREEIEEHVDGSDDNPMLDAYYRLLEPF